MLPSPIRESEAGDRDDNEGPCVMTNKLSKATTPGELKPELVEDRPNVHRVKPEDYPDRNRKESGSGDELDEDKEYERLNPGSSGTTARSESSGRDKDLA